MAKDHSVEKPNAQTERCMTRPSKGSTARTRKSGKVVLVMKIIARINAYFPDRNYGFLHQNNNGMMVKHFLHLNNVVSGVPKTGLMARFDSVFGEKGSIAVNVEILGGTQ